jgi:predicted transposase YdaD
MLQSIEEVGMEKGMEKAAINLLRSQLLSKEQISEITGLDFEKLKELEKNCGSDSELG